MYFMGGYFFERWSDMPLAQAEKDYIEQKARELLLKHGETKIPISPETLARREGLDVVYSYIPGNRIGELDGQAKRIIVDERLKNDPPYARCVIAHELGHYVLGNVVPCANNPGFPQNPKAALEQMELEATLFAHALLMPKPYVQKAAEIYNNNKSSAFDSLLDFICDLFKVTKRKAMNRLEECSIDPYSFKVTGRNAINRLEECKIVS